MTRRQSKRKNKDLEWLCNAMINQIKETNEPFDFTDFMHKVYDFLEKNKIKEIEINTNPFSIKIEKETP